MAPEREALRAKLVDAGLSRITDFVVEQAKPTILLQTTEYKDAPIGASRIGGAPDAPADFEWPMWKDKPMSFLAQINLAELAEVGTPLEMPREGLLLFFYHYDREDLIEGDFQEDRKAWRVELVATGSLARHPLPDGFEDWQTFRSRPVEFISALSIPDLQVVEGSEGDLSEPQWRAYINVQFTGREDDRVTAKMFGHPDLVQNEMQSTCEVASRGISWEDPEANRIRESGAPSWKLLLQLGSTFDDWDMVWGDGGTVYFWIKPEDLAAGRFEKTWMIFQSG